MHVSDVLFKSMALNTFEVTRLLARPRPQLYIMLHPTVQRQLLQILGQCSLRGVCTAALQSGSAAIS
jgi:hypothetical protein